VRHHRDVAAGDEFAGDEVEGKRSSRTAELARDRDPEEAELLHRLVDGGELGREDDLPLLETGAELVELQRPGSDRLRDQFAGRVEDLLVELQRLFQVLGAVRQAKAVLREIDDRFPVESVAELKDEIRVVTKEIRHADLRRTASSWHTRRPRASLCPSSNGGPRSWIPQERQGSDAPPGGRRAG